MDTNNKTQEQLQLDAFEQDCNYLRENTPIEREGISKADQLIIAIDASEKKYVFAAQMMLNIPSNEILNVGREGKSSLWVALEKGNEDIIFYLIDQLEVGEKKQAITQEFENGTLRDLVIQLCSENIINLIVPKIEQLIYAVEKGNRIAIMALLPKDPEERAEIVNKVGVFGKSALAVAQEQKNQKVIDMLFPPMERLLAAVESLDEEQVKMVLKTIPTQKIRDLINQSIPEREDKTLLMIAKERVAPAIYNLLFPLHEQLIAAIQNDEMTTIGQIIGGVNTAGFNQLLNTVGIDGSTALDLAKPKDVVMEFLFPAHERIIQMVNRGNLEGVKRFLEGYPLEESKKIITQKGRDNVTPLDVAELLTDQNIAQFLSDKLREKDAGFLAMVAAAAKARQAKVGQIEEPVAEEKPLEKKISPDLLAAKEAIEKQEKITQELMREVERNTELNEKIAGYQSQLGSMDQLQEDNRQHLERLARDKKAAEEKIAQLETEMKQYANIEMFSDQRQAELLDVRITLKSTNDELAVAHGLTESLDLIIQLLLEDLSGKGEANVKLRQQIEDLREAQKGLRGDLVKKEQAVADNIAESEQKQSEIDALRKELDYIVGEANEVEQAATHIFEEFKEQSKRVVALEQQLETGGVQSAQVERAKMMLRKQQADLAMLMVSDTKAKADIETLTTRLQRMETEKNLVDQSFALSVRKVDAEKGRNEVLKGQLEGFHKQLLVAKDQLLKSKIGLPEEGAAADAKSDLNFVCNGIQGLMVEISRLRDRVEQDIAPRNRAMQGAVDFIEQGLTGLQYLGIAVAAVDGALFSIPEQSKIRKSKFVGLFPVKPKGEEVAFASIRGATKKQALIDLVIACLERNAVLFTAFMKKGGDLASTGSEYRSLLEYSLAGLIKPHLRRINLQMHVHVDLFSSKNPQGAEKLQGEFDTQVTQAIENVLGVRRCQLVTEKFNGDSVCAPGRDAVQQMPVPKKRRPGQDGFPWLDELRRRQVVRGGPMLRQPATHTNTNPVPSPKGDELVSAAPEILWAEKLAKRPHALPQPNRLPRDQRLRARGQKPTGPNPQKQ